tara:strand:+ start:132393 stop:132575 length:183 start_codon:yes stop_codon:yes gene_type:complete
MCHQSDQIDQVTHSVNLKKGVFRQLNPERCFQLKYNLYHAQRIHQQIRNPRIAVDILSVW